jgi:hypothetical protein
MDQRDKCRIYYHDSDESYPDVSEGHVYTSLSNLNPFSLPTEDE